MKDKFDKLGRLILKTDITVGLVYRYKYEQNNRIVNISLKGSKQKTILTEFCINDSYVLKKKKDYSDKFIVTCVYNETGYKTKETRYNKKNRKKYIRHNIIFKNDEPVLWVEQQEGKSNLGFKIELPKHNL